MAEKKNAEEEEKSLFVRKLVIPPLPSTERGHGLHLGSRINKTPCIAYGTQNIVVLRGLGKDNEQWVAMNAVHSVNVSVAKISPNGEWVCSGDKSGQVYVWAHKSFVIKNEIQVGKDISDIAYDFEGKRIVAVGKSKKEKGKAFPWNTNNKLGELTGASKGFIACAFSTARPLRIICGGEDYNVYLYKGPPFKFEKSARLHKGYVNCVKYHPNNKEYVSVSSDKKIFKFDGKTGEKTGEIADKNNGHKGTIYELCFNKDGSKFITSSADKTCKIWDWKTGKVLNTITFGKEVTDMQVSCIWRQDGSIYSVSLNGHINELAEDKKAPIKVFTGHRVSVQNTCIDRGNGYLFSVDMDSKVVRTEYKTGTCMEYKNKKAHGEKLIKFVAVDCKGKTFWTAGIDDRICRTIVKQDCKNPNGVTLKINEKGIKLDGATKCMAASKTNENMVVCGTSKEKIIILEGIDIKTTISVKYVPVAIDISPDNEEIAVAGDDCTIRFINIKEAKEVAKIKSSKYYYNQMFATDLKYNPKGQYIAVSDKKRNIWIWDRKSDLKRPFNSKHNKSYCMHSSTPYSIAWSPDGKTLVSGGNDAQIIYWPHALLGGDHYEGLNQAFFSAVKSVQFIDNKTVIGGGSDGTIRIFQVPSGQANKKPAEAVEVNDNDADNAKDNE